jgi:hypothetical protein
MVRQLSLELERSVSTPAHLYGRTCCQRVVPGSSDVDNQWPWETAECRAEVGGGSSSDDSRDNITRFERRASSQVRATTSDDCEIAVQRLSTHPPVWGRSTDWKERLDGSPTLVA